MFLWNKTAQCGWELMWALCVGLQLTFGKQQEDSHSTGLATIGRRIFGCRSCSYMPVGGPGCLYRSAFARLLAVSRFDHPDADHWHCHGRLPFIRYVTGIDADVAASSFVFLICCLPMVSSLSVGCSLTQLWGYASSYVVITMGRRVTGC